MAIKFDHAVKYNGKYYPANTLIEEATQKPAEAAETAEAAEVEENTKAKPEAAQKPAKGRKKGDA